MPGWQDDNAISIGRTMSPRRSRAAEGSTSAFCWDIHAVVAELRTLRIESATRRLGGNTPNLPSKKSLIHILDSLTASLFPNRLGLPELTTEGVDYFVGNTLDAALRELVEQVRKELDFFADETSDRESLREQANILVRDFATRLPGVRRMLESDIEAAFRGDPAARSSDEVLVCYPGITAVTHHRLAHVLYTLGAPLVARMIAEIAHSTTGIDIHPGAHVGGSFFIDHGTGVVIGESTVIGERVRIYQAVTLGAKSFPKNANGEVIKGKARHPIVEDDVVIYAGATLLGRITIGRGSVIGGNVWLTRSVPPESYITQATVLTESFEGGSGI